MERECPIVCAALPPVRRMRIDRAFFPLISSME